MATEINAGRVAMVPKGEWSASTAYTRLDVVQYNGSSYVAIQDSTGQNPSTATTYWQLLASGVDPSNYYTKNETNTKLASKQDALVSGQNIKTVNGQSVLGAGNLELGELFVVRMTQHNSVYTADKSVSEIYEASYTNGKPVIAVMRDINNPVFILTDCDPDGDSYVFSSIESNAVTTLRWQQHADDYTYELKTMVLQPHLVSGTNIKTLNNESLLGSGNVTISGKSAYQSYVDTTTDNPPKTEAEWVASLKGEDGVSLGDVAIADNLTTDDATKVLSAKQGYLLGQKVIEINGGEKQYEGEWRKGFYIDTSGQKQVSANWGRTDPIFLKAGQRVAVKTQSVHFSAIVQTDENESYYTPLVRVVDGGTELRWHVYTATEDIWVICFGKVSNNDVEAKVIYQQKYTTVSQFNSFVSEIANSYLYLGIATPSTNPGIPNRKVFYFATVAGVYTNFGSIELAKGINILKYNGSTWSVDVLSEIDSEPIAGSDNTAESNAIYDSTDWLRTEVHELKCVTAITGQYIDHDGNLQSGPSWKISKPFKVKKGQVLNMVSKSSGYSMWSKYENGTYTPLFTGNLANIKYTYICPQDMMMVLCGKIIDEWYDCTIENPSPFEGMYQKECCLLIESGSYNNGIKIAQQNRIRTRQMVNANFSLELNDGYKVVLIIYYNRSKTVEREVLTPTCTKFDIVYDGYVNIVFGKTDDSNLTGYENPVKTLTQYTNCLTSEVTSLETETNYYKHLIEYGGFNYTTIQETNDPRRLRFNKIVYKSFTVTTKSLAKIYRALHYNLEGEFTYIEEFFPYLDSYEHTGIDGVRLVFCGSSSTETAMTTTDVIKNWRTPQDEFSDNLTEDLIIQGTVNNQGQPVSSNLRCITKVLNRPFSIELNNDYIIRGYELYTKDNEPINMFTMSSTVRSLTYGCAGFNIRLILSKSNVEETISAKSNIIKSFKPRLDLSNYEICDQYELLGRPAKNACIGVITRKDGGSIWSDGKVWRKAIDNTLAISAKYYITADASTGETLAGNGENEVNWIASITKAFTADLVARYVTDYNELVTIEAGDLAGVTTEVLQEGDIISIGDLLYAALLPSDNASAHTLERVIGKKINPSAATSSDARTAFLNKMQEVTQQLGMTHTSQFWNGWGALLSSCSDVVKLFKDINDNYPIINTVWSKLNHTVTITGDNARTVQVVSTTPQWARNFLSTWKGGKTGSSSTRAAYAFIWEFNNHEYISVELDCGFGRAFSERFMNAGRILDEIKL